MFAEAIDGNLYDQSLAQAIKTGFNYGFYKFGLELSLIAMVYVAWCRMDLLAAILLAFVLVLSLLRRSVCRVLWPFLLIYLCIQLPLQYAMTLGLPHVFCIRKQLIEPFI